MASNAWWAYGSAFKVGNDGTPETFAKVAEVLDISGPNMSMETIDVSSQDSVNGWREYIAGWRDAGEISISANWIPAAATQDKTTGILSKFLDNDTHNYQIVTASNGSSGTITIGLTGIVTGFGVNLPLTEQGKVDFSIKLTGKVTFS
jgi:predicted secreted protein